MAVPLCFMKKKKKAGGVVLSLLHEAFIELNPGKVCEAQNQSVSL